MATLRQQLDIAAATQMELQKEIDVRCAPSPLLSPLPQDTESADKRPMPSHGTDLHLWLCRPDSPGLHLWP